MGEDFENYPVKHDDKVSWWEDGNKISKLAATVISLGLLAIFLAAVVRLIIWMF